jgi:hypothetical protein
MESEVYRRFEESWNNIGGVGLRYECQEFQASDLNGLGGNINAVKFLYNKKLQKSVNFE